MLPPPRSSLRLHFRAQKIETDRGPTRHSNSWIICTFPPPLQPEEARSKENDRSTRKGRGRRQKTKKKNLALAE
ncbi:uncharacterized protein A4U43_C05F13780, partial [Asparagus officinalis]